MLVWATRAVGGMFATVTATVACAEVSWPPG